MSRAGAWRLNAQQSQQSIAPWLVSKAWQDSLLPPKNLARALVAAHGGHPEEALIRAAGCSIPRIDPEPLVRALLEMEGHALRAIFGTVWLWSRQLSMAMRR